MPFRPKPAHELHALADEALVGYLLAARAARHPGEREAMQVLLFKHRPDIRRKVALRLYDFPPAVIDEIADRAFLRAMVSVSRAPFAERTLNQFKAWRNVIVQRTVADFFDSSEPDRVRRTVPLKDQVDEDDWGYEPRVESHDEGVADRLDAAVDAQRIEALLAAMPKAKAEALRLVLYEDADAATAAAHYNAATGNGIKPNTIDQWVSRLRKTAERTS